MKTSRRLAAILGHSLYAKRRARLCFGLIAAIFLLQFYCIRELVFMEAVMAFGFVIVALFAVVAALTCFAGIWLRKLGSGLNASGALISLGHHQPFPETTVTALSEAKEEVS